MNKKSLIVSSIIIGLTCLSGYLIYQKLHTNSPDDIKDYTGKYILNPDYKEFHKYEWTDLKTVYPTKLAYDPAWFKLPPDKYIPKEQPIPRTISSISDPIIRRQAYFNFLCRNESVFYITKNYNSSFELKSDKLPTEEGILYLNQFFNTPKINNYSVADTEQKKFINNANNNPFILPIYKDYYYPLIEGHTYNFYGVDLSLNPQSLSVPFYKSTNNQFAEFMDYKGQIFKIEYDVSKKIFLPAKKINNSSTRYYALSKFIERDLYNFGIYGSVSIIYDKKTQTIVNYTKSFYLGTLLPWKDERAISNFSWTKLTPCQENKTIIDKF